RAQVFDRDEFVAFLRVIRTGDVRDPEFRQTLFDVYVSRVYVYDDTFTVDLNSGARADGYALPDPPEDPPGDAGDGVRPLEKDLHQIRRSRIIQCSQSRTRCGFIIRLTGFLP
ncbi:MAG: hypothetical protein IKD72_08425, partial [Clostridia bacterium]|nr:hypothetical protein [Clostridia bacterium]